MPASTSRLSYSDCFDFFEQALADPIGIALAFDYEGDAMQFRLRMNKARVIDREDNALAYCDNPQHPLFGRSQYDELQLKLRKANGKTFVVIERGVSPTGVIPLSELNGVVLEPVKQELFAPPKELVRLTDRRR